MIRGRQAPTRSVRRPPVGLGLLACALAAAQGCSALGWVSQGLFPEKVKAVHELADRPTLVLVDDRLVLLEDRAMTGLVATEVGHLLQQEEVVKTIVDPGKVQELAVRVGDEFRDWPASRVGRELGAQQVIYVAVERVAWLVEPGMYRPTALVRVKVFDCQTGARLFPFPDAGAPVPGVEAPPGAPVESTLTHKASDEDPNAVQSLLRRELARRIARDVSRLFYDWLPRQPQQPFED